WEAENRGIPLGPHQLGIQALAKSALQGHWGALRVLGEHLNQPRYKNAVGMFLSKNTLRKTADELERLAAERGYPSLYPPPARPTEPFAFEPGPPAKPRPPAENTPSSEPPVDTQLAHRLRVSKRPRTQLRRKRYASSPQ